MIATKQETDGALARNSLFVWIALATLALLLIPLVAMQFTTEVRWDTTDFVVMGCLLFGTASSFVLAARKTARRHRVLVAAVFVAAFLYVWTELAVGVFFDFGS